MTNPILKAGDTGVLIESNCGISSEFFGKKFEVINVTYNSEYVIIFEKYGIPWYLNKSLDVFIKTRRVRLVK